MHRHGPSCLKGPVARGRFPQESEGREVRWELVARVRQEIAAGTYETPEKLEAALERLLDRLAE
jgi:hypothetical protein